MGLFDRFPWVNTHDLNLDWIIQKMKEWGSNTDGQVAKAETAATNAETAATNAETAATSAKSSETNAAASVSEASRIEAVVEGQAKDSNSANASAQLVESAAAQSAEEAKTATKWPYDGVYHGYLYTQLETVDPYTTTKMEFLTAPQENGVLYRVSGRIPKRGSFDDSTIRNYHYEKILKMTGSVAGNQISFGDGFAPSIPGLVIAEAETIGMVLFLKSDNSFYKYSSLPLVNANSSSGLFTIDSKGFAIPDDMAADIQVSLQNEGLSPSEVTAYLYVRMKYTF